MKSHLSSAGYLTGYAVLVWQFLRLARKLIRQWYAMKRAAAPIIKTTSYEPARFFSAALLMAGIAFGVLLLLVVNSQQTSTSSPILVLMAGGVAALVVVGALLIVIGVPAYDYVMELRDHSRRLEARLEAIEVQLHAQSGLLEEEFPVQRKLAFMKVSSQRREMTSDRSGVFTTQGKVSVGPRI